MPASNAIKVNVTKPKLHHWGWFRALVLVAIIFRSSKIEDFAIEWVSNKFTLEVV